MSSIVSSFDIFDTCITRSCGTGDNVLYILGKQVVRSNEESLVREFVRSRKTAELELMRLLGKEAVTIDEIYDYFDTSFYSKIPREEIKQKEVDIETHSFVPVKKTVELIESCRKKGRVLFISDMYLTDQILRTSLIELGIMKEDEHIYVSGNVGLTKRSGHLFDYVKEKEQLAHSKWSHYGDDKHNDFKMPKSKGIKASLISTKYTCLEKKWDEISGVSDNQALSVMAGSVRSVRLNNYLTDEDEFVPNLMAPLFLSFTLSLLKEAKQRGINRLYFAARDMYLPYSIAKEYTSIYPDIDLRYLHISTKSLYPAYVKSGTEEELRYVLGLVFNFKPISMLRMFGYSDGEIDEIGTCVDLEKSVSVQRGSADRFIVEMLRGDRKAKLVARCKEKRYFLEKYFSQEGLFDEQKLAIADLGWRCSSQAIMKTILPNEIVYFYFGVSSNRLNKTEIGDIYPFSFGESLKTSLNYQFLIEYYMCRSSEGSTLGYAFDKDGMVVPRREVAYDNQNDILENQSVVLQIARQFRQFYPLLMGAERDWFRLALGFVVDFSNYPQSHMIRTVSPYLFFEHFTSPKPIVGRLGFGSWAYLFFQILGSKMHIRLPQLVDLEWTNATIVNSLGSFGDRIICYKKQRHYK